MAPHAWRIADALHVDDEGRIDADPCFERVAPVTINSVVFRCADPTWSDAEADRVNAQVREQLLHEGRAVIGRTRVHGRTCLKFTLLNPGARLADIQRLLHDLKARATPPLPLAGEGKGEGGGGRRKPELAKQLVNSQYSST